MSPLPLRQGERNRLADTGPQAVAIVAESLHYPVDAEQPARTLASQSQALRANDVLRSSRRAFARPGTAIVNRTGVRKAYAWVALVAIALNSASPLFANATLRARRADPIGEVCSAYARRPAGDYDGSGGLPNRKHKPSDCALCSLAADDLPVLPPYALLVSVSRPEAEPFPVPGLIAPREFCYGAARPRAPPRAS
ncbi:MAG: DUF2946 domain-containing protein [Betaproteobacteria bacterium]|nr:MAG: DUF2946 domain-containing protein [Betaproteobacteria bacterium]